MVKASGQQSGCLNDFGKRDDNPGGLGTGGASGTQLWCGSSNGSPQPTCRLSSGHGIFQICRMALADRENAVRLTEYRWCLIRNYDVEITRLATDSVMADSQSGRSWTSPLYNHSADRLCVTKILRRPLVNSIR
jgi:hypothetical protein